MPSDERPRLFDPRQDEVSDPNTLAAVAHPLRLRLLGLLRVFGPSTASRLATRCDVSSGLTSYHLRQLADAGLISPADSPEGAHYREKWWSSTSRATFSESVFDDPEARAIGGEYLRSVVAHHEANASRWLDVQHTWPDEWVDASTLSDVALRLTPEQARTLQQDIADVLVRYPRHDAAADSQPGSVVVTFQYQAFPNPEQNSPG